MQTAVNRNGCIPSSPGAASCPPEKLEPNFIADAPPSPSAIPASLRWQQWLILGTCPTKLFFSDGIVFHMASHNICTGIRREDSWQTKQTSRVREIRRSLLILSLDLDGSRQVAVSASKCLFNNHQLPSLDCKQAFAPRTQIYSWNESKARFRQLVGASVAQRRDGACCQMVRRFLQHPSREKRRR